MSEVVVLVSGSSATVYGTYAAAVIYLDLSSTDGAIAFMALDADNRKRRLADATRLLNRQAWIETADTFAERDAMTAFQEASYELAALIAEDPSIVTAPDAGTNIARVYAGGAGVDFARPTSALIGNATKLPPILQDLLGAYLATSSTLVAIGGAGQTGNCHDPFNACSDLDRSGPY